MNYMTTEQILIDQIFDEEFESQGGFSVKDEFFEFFTSSLITRNHEISYDEVIGGVMGQALDGGVDAIYIFVNGELIQEDFSDYQRFKKDINIELKIIQSKNQYSFGEDAIHKLRATALNLLRLDAKFDEFSSKYNSRLIAVCAKFVECYRALIARSPSLVIEFYYATKASQLHPNTELESRSLISDIKQLHRQAEVKFYFISSVELLELHRQRPKTDYPLRLAENPMSSTGKAFVVLVNIKDYFNFISDENGRLNRALFESNVRDYQGSTDVNSGISDSLSSTDGMDFWWLNNGITILAEDVAIASGKELVLISPEIVNGLQTSNEIYNFYSKRLDASIADNRNVLVKIVVANYDDVRDRIIKAANSQNFISKAILRATDPIHRNIEEYLRKFGIFYDRRKNYYRNSGKKPSEIVGLPYMAQVLMSIVDGRPDTARARPSTLLENENEESYKKLFNPDYNVNIFKNAILIARFVEDNLRGEMSSADKNNMKFYVMHDFCVRCLKSFHVSPSKLLNLDCENFDLLHFKNSVDFISHFYKEAGGNDRAAKGSALLDSIRAAQRQYIREMYADALDE